MIGIVSIRSLARMLGIPRSHLEKVAAEINSHYSEWPKTNRRTGKVRIIRSPSDELKSIQTRIAKRLFNAIDFGPEIQGGVRGKSPKSNAKVHLGRKCVVTIDVRKFYPSIRHAVVYRMLRTEFGYGRDVAALVTRLVTHDGQLPQGAPTSTVIANALLRLPVDKPLAAEATRSGIAYTRFIDDIGASGPDPRMLINLAARQLSKRQLSISRNDKLKIMPNSRPQEITGLLVNGRKPSLSKKRRDRVRAAIHEMKSLREGQQRADAIRSILGRIAHVKQFNEGSANRLERLLNTAD